MEVENNKIDVLYVLISMPKVLLQWKYMFPIVDISCWSEDWYNEMFVWQLNDEDY